MEKVEPSFNSRYCPWVVPFQNYSNISPQGTANPLRGIQQAETKKHC
jgi:hypothetical protein